MKFKFNIPNKITLIRVTLIPLFAIVLLAKIPYRNLFAAIIFGLLSISDFFDGYIARKKRQVTQFGKLIDPIADKLLISTALIFLIGKGVDLWMAIAIIAREVIITGIRIYLLPSRIVVPASNFGKAKTVVQSAAIIFVLLQLPFSWYAMLIAALLTLFSGLEYFIHIRQMTGNNIVNLANLITLGRLLLIIPFAYYFINDASPVYLIIFAIITLSDKLDGISARLMDQRTELGSALDSFTDWALILTTFVLLWVEGLVKIYWILLFLIPSIVSGIMKLKIAKIMKKVPVSATARLGVGLTYITIIGIMIRFIYRMHLLVLTILVIYSAMIGYIFTYSIAVKKKKNLKASS